jgi:hypothetical protein
MSTSRTGLTSVPWCCASRLRTRRGLPDPWRAGRVGLSGVGQHGMEDPARCWTRSRPAAVWADVEPAPHRRAPSPCWRGHASRRRPGDAVSQHPRYPICEWVDVVRETDPDVIEKLSSGQLFGPRNSDFTGTRPRGAKLYHDMTLEELVPASLTRPQGVSFQASSTGNRRMIGCTDTYTTGCLVKVCTSVSPRLGRRGYDPRRVTAAAMARVGPNRLRALPLQSGHACGPGQWARVLYVRLLRRSARRGRRLEFHRTDSARRRTCGTSIRPAPTVLTPSDRQPCGTITLSGRRDSNPRPLDPQ